MDSVTQVVLGASVAAAVVPKEQRRRAAVIGAALGTLPDLDVLIDYGSAVANFSLHRGFSHSLFVLVPFSVVLWGILKRYYGPVRENPRAWFWAIMLPLVTHPLLDAHNAYGTQLFWPMDVTPTMWSTLFVIDPFYTLPLLIGMLAILIAPTGKRARNMVVGGLALSSVYIGWSWIAKYQVNQIARDTTQLTGDDVRIFTTPTPFNTFMWRVLVLKGDEYQEGFYHFLFPKDIQFSNHSIDRTLFDDAQHLADIDQLQWFADGYNRIDIIDDKLMVSDLRMGFEGNYAFRHVIARYEQGEWLAITSEQLGRELNGDVFGEFWAELTNSTE